MADRIVNRYIHAFDALLRVPYLFVIDAVLSSKFADLYYLVKSSPMKNNTTLQTVENTLQIPYGAFLILVFLVFPIAVFISLLLTKHLIRTYSLLICLGAIWISYDHNTELTRLSIELNNGTVAISNSAIVVNSGLQFLCSLMFCFCFVAPHWQAEVMLNRVLRILFKLLCVAAAQLPTIFVCIDLSPTVILRSPALAVTVPIGFVLLVCVHKADDVYNFFINGYLGVYRYVRLFGVQSFLETHWRRLNVPLVLRYFWCTKVFLMIVNLSERFSNPGSVSDFVGGFFSVLRDSVFVHGCNNYLSLAGMTAVVSVVCELVVYVMAYYIGVQNETEWHYGVVASVLFFLLALQTGVTGLQPAERISRLYRNFYLLSMAMLHFVHNMVKRVLLNLSAIHDRSWTRHCRPLSMCAFLITLSIVFLTFLWTKHSLGAWYLAATAFGIELIVKIVFTLIQYALFMLDARSEEQWVHLDDYIYWTKAVGNSIEFSFGVFLFCNGVWIFIFESGGLIRAVMMTIHAYFNIFVQGKEGLKNLRNRQLADQRLARLEDADPTELMARADVCPVCYSEMQTAKVTPCRHYYHVNCLRKWLHVRYTCPMCHQPLFPVATTEVASPR